jgi:hypothetical protein
VKTLPAIIVAAACVAMPMAGAGAPEQPPTDEPVHAAFVAAMRELAVCYNNANTRLTVASNKVIGEFKKTVRRCTAQGAQNPQPCVDKAKVDRDAALGTIEDKRTDVKTTNDNTQAVIEAGYAAHRACTSDGCCAAAAGPPVGPDGKACARQGAPQGWGACEANFSNILNGY